MEEYELRGVMVTGEYSQNTPFKVLIRKSRTQAKREKKSKLH